MDFEKILNLGVEKNIINETQRNGLIDMVFRTLLKLIFDMFNRRVWLGV